LPVSHDLTSRLQVIAQTTRVRTPNNQATFVTICAALKAVMVPNTQLAAQSTDGSGGLSQISCNHLNELVTGSFPVVHIGFGPLSYTRRSRSTSTGLLTIKIRYFDRWDENGATLDALFASVSADLLRMAANIESNDHLVVAGFANLEAVTKMELSPYYGEVDRRFPGLSLVTRMLTLTCIPAEYDF